LPRGPSIPAKDVEGNTQAFTSLMRRLIAVPRSEIKAKLDAEKAAKRTSKRASRVSAASSKGR